jgi:hypothetical protein
MPKGSVAAHATLEAAIGWSVDLLSARDRAMLLRLWPFEGGFTLPAAEAVGPATGAETLESLSSLVNRSMVAADTSVLPTRFLMLESVRAYCRSIDPDPAAAGAAHARWIRRLADQCGAEMRTRRAGRFLRSLGPELPNIRAGLAHDLKHEPVMALRSVARFGLFFSRRVHNAEAVRWVRAAVAAAPDAPPLDRARATIFSIALADFAGDFAEASGLVASAAEGVFTELTDREDPVERGELHYFLGFVGVETQHVDIALRQAELTVEIGATHGIGWIAAAGRTVHAVARALRHSIDGEATAMVEAAQEAQRLSRGWPYAWATAVLAETYLRQPCGPAAEALVAVRAAVAEFEREEDIPFAVGALALGALALARQDRPADAVRLMAGVRAHADRLGFRAASFLAPDAAWIEDSLTELLDSPARAAAEADGARMAWADLVGLVHAGGKAGPWTKTSPVQADCKVRARELRP